MIYENEYMRYDDTTKVLRVKDVIKEFTSEIQNINLRQNSDDKIFTRLPGMHFYRVVLPDCMERLSDNAFKGMNMSKINLPNGITYIGDAAFINCYWLKSIIWPTGTKCIRLYTFYKCERLEEVVLPSGLTQICSFAFSNCKVLKNITIPETVQEFGAYVFSGCESLETIKVPRLLYDEYYGDDSYFRSDTNAKVIVYDETMSTSTNTIEESETITEDTIKAVSSSKKEIRCFNGRIRTNLISNKMNKV